MKPDIIAWQCGEVEALRADIQTHQLNPDQPDKAYVEPRPSRNPASPSANATFIEQIVPGEFYEAHAAWNVNGTHERLLVLPEGKTGLRWAWHIAKASGEAK